MPSVSNLAMEAEPLYPAFNEMVLLAVNALMPDGFDTTDNEEHCNTHRKLVGYWKATDRILVWSGASDCTIFGDPKVNHAFRAWHDWVHVHYDLPFTPEGEHTVMLIQQRQCDTMGALIFTPDQIQQFWRILEAEIDGQVEHYEKHKEFIADQRTFCQNYMKAKYNG